MSKMKIMVALAADAEDVVAMNVPLLLRCLEYARESITSDVELHEFVERILSEAKASPTALTMAAYPALAPTSAS